jgi:23S rRNA (uracil1939-C5)-methyltransferase
VKRRPTRRGRGAADTAPAGPAWEAVIDHLGAQSDGVVGDGVVGDRFVSLTLPGERVLARGAGERAELVEVLDASLERVTPPCRHFGDCGGCALQHWRAAPYLAWKAEQIRLALARERLEAEILPPFAAPPGTRRRLALHARKAANGQILLGFKARRSWRVVPIEACAVAEPGLQAALPVLREIAAPFLEHPTSAPTVHVTATLTGLDIDVTGVERRSGGLSADARLRAAEASARADVARVTLAGEVVYQARAPLVRAGRATVALPPGAFLQAVPAAEAAMTEFAAAVAGGARRIADLYCGVGTFTFPLAEIAPVLAADASAPAVRALASACATAPGLKAIVAEARDLDRRPLTARELVGIDVAVFDPPRAGAPVQARELAASACARVVAVSCNPATFARDARLLADGGLRLLRVRPVDQFLWSPHIELVAEFSRDDH